MQRVQGQARMVVAPDHAYLMLKRSQRPVIVFHGPERIEPGCIAQRMVCEAPGALPVDQGQDRKCRGKSREHSEDEGGIGFRECAR